MKDIFSAIKSPLGIICFLHSFCPHFIGRVGHKLSYPKNIFARFRPRLQSAGRSQDGNSMEHSNPPLLSTFTEKLRHQFAKFFRRIRMDPMTGVRYGRNASLRKQL